MKIATTNEYNLIDCCPCEPPEHPAARTMCQSIFSRALAVGFFQDLTEEDYDDDGNITRPWEIFPKRVGTRTRSGSGDDAASEPGVSWIGLTGGGSATSVSGNELDQTYNIITQNADDVVYDSAVNTTVCTFTGDSNETAKNVFYWGPLIGDGSDVPNHAYQILTTHEASNTVVALEGEANPAYAVWEAAAAVWDAAHPAYAAEYATWLAAHTLHAAWQVLEDAYLAWIAGGMVGDEPPPPGDEPPAEGPEPPARPVAPAAVYPPCTFAVDTTFTAYEYTQVVPGVDPNTIADGFPVTTTERSLIVGADVTAFARLGGGVTTTTDETLDFGTGLLYLDWVAEAKAALLSDIDALGFPGDDSEAFGLNECQSQIVKAPQPDYNFGNSIYPFLDAQNARFRLGIPDTPDYAAYPAAHAAFPALHAAWVPLHAAHLAWVAAGSHPPEPENPLEPKDPVLRTVFEAQWDLGFFSEAWTDWKALKDAYDAVVALRAAHAAWITAGSNPPEPPNPDLLDDPGAEPTRPTKLSSGSWTWDGDPDNAWSEYFEIPMPTEAGVTKRVNLLTKSYHCARTGVVPTAHGETFIFDA